MDTPEHHPSSPVLLDTGRVRAITLDLDDTLWPIWPTIARAERVLLDWLAAHAPATADWCADTDRWKAVRAAMAHSRPELAHDLSALRRESIRTALVQAGDDPSLAEPAFDVFFAARQQVEPLMYIIDIAFAAMQEAGVTPKVKAIRGGTDGAQLSFKGLPCPNIFAGGLNFHGRYEFVPVQSIEKAMNVVVKIAELTAKRYC